MESQRGRTSSSADRSLQARHTPSPSSNNHFANPTTVTSNPSTGTTAALDFDPQLQQQQQQLQQPSTFATASSTTTSFNQNLTSSSNSQPSFDGNFSFATDSQPFFQDQSIGGSNTADEFASQGSNPSGFQDFVNFDAPGGLSDSFDPPLFSNDSATSGAVNSSAADSPFFDGAGVIDPILVDSTQAQQTPPMTTQTQSPTPPHLLAPGMQRQSSGSPHVSPALGQGAFQPAPQRHVRNGSLDPTVAYGQMQAGGSVEWAGNPAFQSGHRRTYSDARSDISSSAHPSPFLASHDNFDQLPNHSPHLGPQDPAMFQEVMGIGQVSLSEASQAYISPAHSPHISPRLGPSAPVGPAFPTNESFNLVPGMPGNMNNRYDVQHSNMYGIPNQEPFPSLNQPIPSVEFGQADAMTPPEINIQLAPPSRTSSFEPTEKQGIEGALSPPERASRVRAKSDPFSNRGSSPGARDTLSPHAAGVGSRSPSPSGKSRRSSTSSVPNRDYILDLADPNRPSSQNSGDSGSQSKRTQKHPATFQCGLCPKRFTRAYNLRSHLRTHTDERPFVCSVCSKAFARQHDRKRHEGLHSGEKKFVCKGPLKDGNSWGCGRRFARADALGRHFRSEAGRICIKPLMDEETYERLQGQPAEVGAGMPMMAGMVPGQPMMPGQPVMDAYGVNAANANFGGAMPMAGGLQMRLPQALLQQYPSLGGIWDQLPQATGPEDMEGDISGRSSFDASSAGEYEEEDYGPQGGGAYGWASDVGP